jgi:radical SAM superfamily enzyme YgiQ (UPF0313 family)
MKLILIFPNFERWSMLDQNWHQHGIAHLYTETRKAGFNVEYWDGRDYSMDQMFEKIKNDPIITHIGISVLSVYRDNAVNILRWLESEQPQITTIVGGIHVTACPEDFGGLADYIIKGEGEKLLPDILRGVVSIPGIYEGTTENLDELEYINRSIFSQKERPINPILPEPFATIINSRACPGQCTFCAPISHNVFGKKFKIRSVPHIIGEIEHLIDTMGIRSFFLHDDNSIANVQYMLDFCDSVKDLKLKWWCQGRADIVEKNPILVEKMAIAGCSGMLVGFESGSDRILEYIKKGVTREQNIKACHILHDNDMMVWANLMVGFPTEQPHEVLETIMMVEKMHPDLVSICTFTPFPGSYLYDYCKENKLMPENHTQDYWNRGQFEQKILGPDYAFLQWAIQKMCDITYKGGKL